MSTEILIIDDNSDIRLILDELIKDAGYKTRLAANFNQALAEISELNSENKLYRVTLKLLLATAIIRRGLGRVSAWDGRTDGWTD